MKGNQKYFNHPGLIQYVAPPGKKRWPPSGQAQAATEYNHAVLGKPTLPGWRARRSTAPTQPVAAQNRQRPVVLLFKGIHEALKRAAQFFRIVMQPLLQKVHGRRIPHIGCEHFQLGTQDFSGDKQCFHTIPNVAVKKMQGLCAVRFHGAIPQRFPIRAKSVLTKVR